jgi:hypothetical protein
LVSLLGDVPKGAQAHLQGQALARVAVRSGGLRVELLGEAFAWRTQAVSATVQSVLLDLAEVMVRAQALED